MKSLSIPKFLIILIFLLLTSWLLSFQSPSAQESPCLTCHPDFKKPAKSVHAALGMGCETCHTKVQGKEHPQQKGSIILMQNMPVLCYGCHDQSKFKGKAIHAPVAGGMCTGCHNPHSSNFSKILVSEIPGLCYNCHDQSKFKGKVIHAPVTGGMCTSCHSPHKSDSGKLLVSDIPDLCYMCHDKAKFTKKNVHAAIPAVGCATCHAPHASNNTSLLPKAINDVCITCHIAQESGRHIVALPGKKVHPLKGAMDPNFPAKMIKVPDPKRPGREIYVPDPKNPGKEISCITCHDPHSSDFRRLFVTEKICLKCHKY